MKKKIKRLEIDLFSTLPISKTIYEKRKANFISSFTTTRWVGSFFPRQIKENNPILGEARWNEYYPSGYDDWVNSQGSRLTPTGHRKIINKIDELIDYINKKL